VLWDRHDPTTKDRQGNVRLSIKNISICLRDRTERPLAIFPLESFPQPHPSATTPNPNLHRMWAANTDQRTSPVVVVVIGIGMLACRSIGDVRLTSSITLTCVRVTTTPNTGSSITPRSNAALPRPPSRRSRWVGGFGQSRGWMLSAPSLCFVSRLIRPTSFSSSIHTYTPHTQGPPPPARRDGARAGLHLLRS
jgi:hypothetical protein